MIPKMNMKVVIPNMNTLGGDEVKPGLLLKAVVLSACTELFLRKHICISQEDVYRGNIEYDIDSCEENTEVENLEQQRRVA